MGETASMDREGGQEAGLFPLNISEEVFSKIMKKFKSKSFSPCDPCALSFAQASGEWHYTGSSCYHKTSK